MTPSSQPEQPIPYEQCLELLWGRGHELHGEKFGLEPIQTILAALGHPERRYPTAIVAGTNGKGSTCAMLAAILDHSGYKTGLYTSPHLVRVNERMRVRGEDISDSNFALEFTRVYRQAEELVATRALAKHPSFFEYLTATAFLHFAHAAIDFAVLEVGMGGRLDATNVVDPCVAVITNVDLDHQQFLGTTHAAIAAEKAGVIKPGKPIISGCEHPDARAVISRRSCELGAPLVETHGLDGISNLLYRNGHYTFDLNLEGCPLRGVSLSLPGSFQIKNAAVAATAAWHLARQGFRIPCEAIRLGLQSASWPGRLEATLKNPLLLLDGAHNPAAASELAGYVRQHLSGRRLRLVYGSMRDKAIGEITSLLFPLAETVILTRPQADRAALPEEILANSSMDSSKVIIEPDPVRAVERALLCSSPEDVVLAAGSLFLVGAIKKAIQEGNLVLNGMARPALLSECC